MSTHTQHICWLEQRLPADVETATFQQLQGLLQVAKRNLNVRVVSTHFTQDLEQTSRLAKSALVDCYGESSKKEKLGKMPEPPPVPLVMVGERGWMDRVLPVLVNFKRPPVLAIVIPTGQNGCLDAPLIYAGYLDMRDLQSLREPIMRQSLKALFWAAHQQCLTANAHRETMLQADVMEHFAHAMAHDVKAPVRIATKFLELLQNKLPEEVPEDVNDYTRVAIEHLQKSQRMIDELRKFSHISWESASLVEVDLNDLCVEIRRELNTEIHEGGMTVSQAALPTIQGHLAYLRDAITEVIKNAIFYRREVDAALVIDCDSTDHAHVITFTDNGLGIDSAMLPYAFELFQRFHEDACEGTGTGLARARKIIEAHGGRIWLDSVWQQGTTVYILLPKANHEVDF